VSEFCHHSVQRTISVVISFAIYIQGISANLEHTYVLLLRLSRCADTQYV